MATFFSLFDLRPSSFQRAPGGLSFYANTCWVSKWRLRDKMCIYRSFHPYVLLCDPFAKCTNEKRGKIVAFIVNWNRFCQDLSLSLYTMRIHTLRAIAILKLFGHRWHRNIRSQCTSRTWHTTKWMENLYCQLAVVTIFINIKCKTDVNHSHNACWFGDTLSHWSHFCGPELCRTICSFNVYRFDSHALQIWHCIFSRRTVFSVCILRMCDKTSLRVVNVLAPEINGYQWTKRIKIELTHSVTHNTRKSPFLDLYSFHVCEMCATAAISPLKIFYCSSCTEMCAPFFRHEIVYEHQDDIWISRFCRIHCRWTVSYRPLCAVTCAHSNPPYLEKFRVIK